MKVIELLETPFNTPAPFQFQSMTPTSFSATFMSGENPGKVVGRYFEDEESWDINFLVNDDVEPTGTGNQYGVFSTVAAVITQFVKEQKPNRFSFSAETDQPARVRLYGRLAPRLAHTVGYTLTTRNEYGECWFIFDRI